MTRPFLCAALAVLFSALITTASAQDAPTLPSFETDGTLFWAEGGSGLVIGGGGGPSLLGSLAFRSDNHVGTARSLVYINATQTAVSLFEVFLGADYESEGDEALGAGELALLYGRPLHETPGLVIVGSLGLASVTLFNQTEETAIGIPAQLDLTFRPARYVGLTLSGVGNVNRLRTFGGAALTLRIGKLR